MTATDIVLVLFIIALLAYAIYDEFIMPRRHGETLLSLPLLRRGRVDAFIFVGLIAILIYNNVTSHGALLTTWLLCALALMAIICSGSARQKSFLNPTDSSSPMYG